MHPKNLSGKLGNVTILGVTPKTAQSIDHNFQTMFGFRPRIVDYGSAGRLFFYTNQGDLVKNKEVIALKRGHVRNLQYSPLSTQQLLDQKILTPKHVEVDDFSGNAQLICASLTEPALTIYQTFMALPQLFYTSNRDGTYIYASDYRALLILSDRVEVDEDIVPMFFLFRHVPGSRTYIRNVRRLFAGEILTWRGGEQNVRILRTLNSDPAYHSIHQVTSEKITQLYETMCAVMGAYLADFSQQGLTTANLFSGGVDSSIIQIILNRLVNQKPLRSYSYEIKAASFEPEVKYTQQASQILGTDHTFFKITPNTFLEKIDESIEILARPQLNTESSPCKLALSQYLADPAMFYFAGQGADALHGLGEAYRTVLYNIAGDIPGSASIMKFAARLLKFLHPDYAYGIRLVAELLPKKNPELTLNHPLHLVAVLSNMELMLRSFGESVLLSVLNERINLTKQYLSGADLQENLHTIDLLTAGYEPAAIDGQYFTANGSQLIEFYLDEEVIRAAYAFIPKVRYLKGLTTKPLLKEILTQQGYKIIATRPKLSSTFNTDLYAWFRNGSLTERARAIERPGFLSQSDFEQLLSKPNRFSWNLLLWDIFKTQVLPKYDR